MRSSNINEDIAVIAITVCVTTAGLVLNAMALNVIRTSRNLHNSFGILCGGFLLSHFIVLLVTLLWIPPVVAIPGTWAASVLASVVAHIVNSQFYSAVTILLLIALNRFTAISFPTKYGTLFTTKLSIVCVGGTFALWLTLCSIYYIDGCTYTFHRDTYLWRFDKAGCGKFMSFYVDFVLSLILAISALLVDACAFFRLRNYTERMQQCSSRAFVKIHAIRKRRREVILFAQSCLYTLVFVIGLFLFHIVSHLTSSRLATFACVTVAFQMMHVLCGVIFLSFNWKRNVLRTEVKSLNIT